ncbi:unnamed protein product, partial [Prorocentrum cordatum]
MRLVPEATLPSGPLGGLPARAPRRFASRIFRHLEALEATRLWGSLGAERREGLLSSGGPGAGALWLQMPAQPADYFPTAATAPFRAATLRRLGALSSPPGATCRIKRRGGDCEDICGQQLDRTLRHPQLCKQGPARMRPHRALAATLARLLRECRAEVDIERTVTELERVTPTGRVEEAILDLVVSFPGSVQPLYVDVTIRCPHAARYLRAATVAGDAADEAARGKRQRYGSAVLPVAARLVPRWRAALERITQWAAAEIDLLALGCAPTAAQARVAWGRVSGVAALAPQDTPPVAAPAMRCDPAAAAQRRAASSHCRAPVARHTGATLSQCMTELSKRGVVDADLNPIMEPDDGECDLDLIGGGMDEAAQACLTATVQPGNDLVTFTRLPLSYLLLEQAGGESITGRGRVVGIPPTSVHQRAPIILGSPDDVDECFGFYDRCQDPALQLPLALEVDDGGHAVVTGLAPPSGARPSDRQLGGAAVNGVAIFQHQCHCALKTALAPASDHDWWRAVLGASPFGSAAVRAPWPRVGTACTSCAAPDGHRQTGWHEGDQVGAMRDGTRARALAKAGARAHAICAARVSAWLRAAGRSFGAASLAPYPASCAVLSHQPGQQGAIPRTCALYVAAWAERRLSRATVWVGNRSAARVHAPGGGGDKWGLLAAVTSCAAAHRALAMLCDGLPRQARQRPDAARVRLPAAS